MRKNDYTVFCEKFKPKMSEDGEELTKFHWGGEDLVELQKTPPDRIWTILDCDGKLYISPGWHYVNRLEYLITEIPYKEGQRDYRY